MKNKVALVGAGYWGKNLARNFYELGALNMICDSNDLLEGSYRERYPDARFTTSYSEVLRNETVTGVAIATPAATHATLAMDALLLGHGCCETRALLADVGQFAEGVGKLDPASIELEAFGDAWVARFRPR